MRLMGDRAESLVQEIFEDKGFIANTTANSGAKNYDGDMTVPIDTTGKHIIRLEVKKRNTESFSINMDYLNQIKEKSLQHGGIPALTVVNKNNRKLVILDLDDFVELLTWVKL